MTDRFSESSEAKQWLQQFNDVDRGTAVELLDELLLVNASTFSRGMISLAERVLNAQGQETPMALYTELEVEKDSAGSAEAIFADSEEGRAVGDGPGPLGYGSPRSEIGSEGIVSNLITSTLRNYHGRILNHPGPDQLRSKKVRTIVIATDFIGSGKRVYDLLDSFQRVASIRSWRSYRLISFVIIAYSATSGGIRKIEKHPLKPKLEVLVGCPTVVESLKASQQGRITGLCGRYHTGQQPPLGFGQMGALIAFEHGIPNNSPAILHKFSNGWKPLFKGRATVGSVQNFPDSNEEAVLKRLRRWLGVDETERRLTQSKGLRWIHTLLVLSSIENGCRDKKSISSKTHIDQHVLEGLLQELQVVSWICARCRLTALGRSELRRFRRRRQQHPILPKSDKPFYYPTQLKV